MIRILTKMADKFADLITSGKVDFMSDDQLSRLTERAADGFSAVASIHPAGRLVDVIARALESRNEPVQPAVRNDLNLDTMEI